MDIEVSTAKGCGKMLYFGLCRIIPLVLCNLLDDVPCFLIASTGVFLIRSCSNLTSGSISLAADSLVIKFKFFNSRSTGLSVVVDDDV